MPKWLNSGRKTPSSLSLDNLAAIDRKTSRIGIIFSGPEDKCQLKWSMELRSLDDCDRPMVPAFRMRWRRKFMISSNKSIDSRVNFDSIKGGREELDA